MIETAGLPGANRQRHTITDAIGALRNLAFAFGAGFRRTPARVASKSSYAKLLRRRRFGAGAETDEPGRWDLG